MSGMDDQRCVPNAALKTQADEHDHHRSCSVLLRKAKYESGNGIRIVARRDFAVVLSGFYLCVGDLALAWRVLDPARSDCPGKIVCTIDGELVCRDECPLGEASTKASALPPCCRGKE